MHHGRVKSYSTVSGYGFILSDHGEFFFHVTAISMYWRPAAGDEVTFAIASRNGRNYATNVRLCD